MLSKSDGICLFNLDFDIVCVFVCVQLHITICTITLYKFCLMLQLTLILDVTIKVNWQKQQVAGHSVDVVYFLKATGFYN